MERISGGEVIEQEDPCPRCLERMQKYGVPCFYCSLDGTVDAIDKCFTEAKARRAQIEEDWEWQRRETVTQRGAPPRGGNDSICNRCWRNLKRAKRDPLEKPCPCPEFKGRRKQTCWLMIHGIKHREDSY